MSLTRFAPPLGPRVDRGHRTKTLYRLEEDRNTALKKAAMELGKVLGYSEDEFWSRTMPEALYAMLESFEPSMVRVVCEAWLANNPMEQEDR